MMKNAKPVVILSTNRTDGSVPPAPVFAFQPSMNMNGQLPPGYGYQPMPMQAPPPPYPGHHPVAMPNGAALPPGALILPPGAPLPPGYMLYSPAPAPMMPAPPPAVPDNGLQVRCLHCKKFFLRSENGPTACAHHSGKFIEPPSWQGGGAGALNLGRSMQKWSCCGEISESAQGCCQGWHREDVVTTQILDKFNPPGVPATSSLSSSSSPSPSSVSQPGSLLDSWLATGSTYASDPRLHVGNPSLNSVSYATSVNTPSGNLYPTPMTAPISASKPKSNTEKEVQKEEEEKELIAEGYIKHMVSKTDTLQGIALRYGAPVDDIKKVNKLFNASSLITRKFIYVRLNRDVTALPPPPEESEEQRRRKAIAKFLDIAQNCSKDEAKAYLADNDWDLAKALQELDADLKWERENGGRRRLLR